MKKLLLFTLVVAFFSKIYFHLDGLSNDEEIQQINKIRLINFSLKIFDGIAFLSERLGLAPFWSVQRQSSVILKYFRNEIYQDFQSEDKEINGVPVRIYRSTVKLDEENREKGCIIYFHGGAFYLGSIESHHSITRDLARRTSFIVISVQYRLAPEHPYPNGLNDCLTVAEHVLDYKNGKYLGIDPRRVFIAGDSAGGNLAAVVTMKLINQETREYYPRGQLLIYPVLQFFDQMLPSNLSPKLNIFYFGRPGQILEFYLNKSISDDIALNKHTSIEQKKIYRKYVDWNLIPEKFRQVYRTPNDDQQQGNQQLIENFKQALHQDISPLLVDDIQLRKLPSTFISSVGHDRLRDQAFIYAGRLIENDVLVEHKHYEKTFHGALNFLDPPFNLEIAQQMLTDLVRYLNEQNKI